MGDVNCFKMPTGLDSLIHCGSSRCCTMTITFYNGNCAPVEEHCAQTIETIWVIVNV